MSYMMAEPGRVRIGASTALHLVLPLDEFPAFRSARAKIETFRASPQDPLQLVLTPADNRGNLFHVAGAKESDLRATFNRRSSKIPDGLRFSMIGADSVEVQPDGSVVITLPKDSEFQIPTRGKAKDQTPKQTVWSSARKAPDATPQEELPGGIDRDESIGGLFAADRASDTPQPIRRSETATELASPAETTPIAAFFQDDTASFASFSETTRALTDAIAAINSAKDAMKGQLELTVDEDTGKIHAVVEYVKQVRIGA
jgi:hypothetical protein